MNYMNFKLLIQQSLTNIYARKLRSLLAILGVVIGSSSVVALLYCSQLATMSVVSQLADLGTNLVSVSVVTNSKNKKLSSVDISDISDSIPTIIYGVPIAFAYEKVSFDGLKMHAAIVGSTDDLYKLAKIKLSHGRFISEFDQDSYCVIGDHLAQKIGNSIGEQIKYGTHYCTIVGVMEPTKSNLFIPIDFDDSIIINLDVILLQSKSNSIRDVVFSLQSSDQVATTELDLRRKFREILPNGRTYFRNPNQIIDKIVEQTRQLSILLGVIGTIALIVGGIGIMNIMLVSVVERKREIGIRRAIGAKVLDIKLLFLAESVSLSLCGGVFGVVFGLIVSFIVAKMAGWPWHILFTPAILGFMIASVVGVFFGYYPAVCAAKLDPVEALRSD
jgi:putative ABC transport system permease protein